MKRKKPTVTEKRTRWTPKKRRFVKAYTGEAFLNGAAAARIAGFSKESAGRIAFRLLQDPKIQKAIQRRLRKSAMSSEEAMARLSMMGRGSIEPFLYADGSGEMEINLSTEEAKRNLPLVRKVKQTKRIMTEGRGKDKETIIETRTELELHDAKDATVQMAKIHGLYTDKDKDGNPMQPMYKVYVGIDPDQV